MVSLVLKDAMNASTASFPAGVDEFEKAGLTKGEGRAIRAPHVAEAPAALDTEGLRIEVMPVAEATRFSSAWVQFANREFSWAVRQDQLPTTHPIVADAPDTDAALNNFDGITYAKGALVLGQLVAHRLLALDPVGLTQGRHVDPALAGAALPDPAAGVRDRAFEELDPRDIAILPLRAISRMP